MPALTAVLSSLPVESVDVLPIGTLQARRGAIENVAFYSCYSCDSCDFCDSCDSCDFCDSCISCDSCDSCVSCYG
jgi:hypothetical protein